MPTPEVIDRVQALHDQLENEPHAALEPVRPQLQRIVREPHDAANYHALTDGLRSAYESLEVEHPKLAAVVQATLNALSAAGL